MRLLKVFLLAGALAASLGAKCREPKEGICVNDAWCDDHVFCNGPERCDASLMSSDERGCAPAEVTEPCLAGIEVCDELLDQCVRPPGCGEDEDHDRDGFASIQCGGLDCDDDDGNIFPGAEERCDDVDDDCDPTTTGAEDRDGDGEFDSTCTNTDGAGVITRFTDCDDTRANVSSDALEECDGLDNNCNGAIDEGLIIPVWYFDSDRDGHGDPSVSTTACDVPEGYTTLGNDCDDTNPAFQPGAQRCDADGNVEVCLSDGLWSKAIACPSQTTCLPQPNGTGLCLQ